MNGGSTRSRRVLVIDDEPDLRTLYELTLLREGYEVESAATVAEGLRSLEIGRFDVVITDMRLPDGLGLDILQGLATRVPREPCIVITAYGSAENAVEALKTGAFDYLTKPVDLRQFRTVVASAIASGQLADVGAATAPARAPAAPARMLDEPGDRARRALRRLVGPSTAMQAVRDRVRRVAGSMAPVLVRGESGTGKELIARAVHACSHRASGPFVAVNCGAIPENLLEAEFFGARKGSYTGSTQDREGYFQAARGGTLFLDEIGDLPMPMQSKLLRAIQERCVRPLGSTQEEAVDVRIVSATHKDLASLVHQGNFRQDLYYRLNVIDIVVPPLREHREDLPELCEALVARIAAESGAHPPTIGPELLEQISRLPLPGNVRELENLLYRALALHDGGLLCLDLPAAAAPAERSDTPPDRTGTEPTIAAALPATVATAPDDEESEPLPADLQSWLDAREREVLVRALEQTGYNRTAAAARLGLNLRQIRYRMARLDIGAPGASDRASPEGDD